MEVGSVSFGVGLLTIREILKDDPGLQAEFDKAKEEEKKQYPHTGDLNKKNHDKQYDDTDDGEDD